MVMHNIRIAAKYLREE